MSEQFARVNDDIDLCYETFGDPADPTVLLVMGLGTQMIAWRDDFCAQIVARGFHVVRFDNRDCGRSTLVAGRPPGPIEMITRSPRRPAYRLEDMADDAAGLLDALGVEHAHVVGASMGGMIAQTLAARHPERVLSLVSIMSATGHRWAGRPHWSILPVFFRTAPTEREAFADYTVKLFSRLGSPGFTRDPEQVRDLARRSFDRGVHSAGTGRQLAAVLASGDRTEQLRSIRAPTTVIHGTHDRMVHPSGGRATARAIPGARLVMIEGMAHDLPREAWGEIIDAIVATTERAAVPESAAA